MLEQRKRALSWAIDVALFVPVLGFALIMMVWEPVHRWVQRMLWRSHR